METTIQISEVNSRDVNTSRGTATVYNVKAGDGREFSTFKAPLGQAAGQLRGQWATVEYQEVQKGKYTNYYLDSVKPGVPENQPGYPVPTTENTAPSQGFSEAPTGYAATGVPGPSDTLATVAWARPPVSHNITYKDDKSAQINRSVAFKAAVELVGTGVVQIAEDPSRALEEINKLTNGLIPIVDGTYASVGTGEAPFVPATSNQSSGDAEAISDGILVDF